MLAPRRGPLALPRGPASRLQPEPHQHHPGPTEEHHHNAGLNLHLIKNYEYVNYFRVSLRHLYK